jgi:hypothetical protein
MKASVRGRLRDIARRLEPPDLTRMAQDHQGYKGMALIAEVRRLRKDVQFMARILVEDEKGVGQL